MKTFFILSAFTLVGTCATPKYTARIQSIKDSIKLEDSTLVINYANTITSKELSTHLYAFSSKDFEGRRVGEIGQKKAAEFIKTYYQKEGIKSPLGVNNYYQSIPEDFFSNGIKASENVLAYIKGSEKPDEVIIISAHLDHLGVTNDGQVNCGADDDGSGTVAIMEIAQAFNIAKEEGHGPKRSILFLHLTAEEIGKRGSEYYVLNPVFPLENTVTDLNIDMIGRVDDIHKNNENYIYLIGSDRLSKELHYLSEKVNNAFFNIDLDYRYNAERDKNQYYTRSDHYNFACKDIPVIFYFNGEHSDYHQPSDTPDKIAYDLLEKRTKLIFATAWQIANQSKRLQIDANNQFLN
ncbi:Bacterial leucyl aminopeptidase precursor [Mariniflexile rhizosphaerae]|uniref:M28 family peptidase n=1 Tax=unclassified Mariniflexile TaxID=2643887 RepID=UPI000E32F77F|nr:M28 family peptidase [Mariniflexile sp. TRM1-10]AXP82909.1 Bacterial leucyl aminopeptidase precursor [Mariniflexile sp. TRM1-10]